MLLTTCISGRVFHYTRAVWLHVQHLGLSPAYNLQNSTHKYIKKLMALPFLPAQYVIPVFTALVDQMRLVSESKLKRYQCKTDKQLHAKIFST